MSAKKLTERRSSPYWIGRIALLIAGILAACSFISTPNPSVFESASKESPFLSTLRDFIPQGWPFFTRDARENTHSAYVQGNDGWEEIVPVSGGSPEFYLGLNRGARLVDGDVAKLALAPPSAGEEEAWTSCNVGENVTECATRTSLEVDGVQKIRPLNPELCGDVIVAESEMIPWSYGKLTRDRKFEIRQVEAECIK